MSSSSSNHSSRSSSEDDSSSSSIESSDEDEVYCICRQPAGQRFMIQCDKCKEWYHGDCVGQKEKDADDIINYYCQKCRQENPRRYRIRYKPTKKEKLIILKTPLDLEAHGICYGPGCTNKKKPPSKYCSVQCGQALARLRVANLLPEIQQKIKAHIGPKVKSQQEKLKQIILQQQEIHAELDFIDQKIDALVKIEAGVKEFRKEQGNGVNGSSNEVSPNPTDLNTGRDGTGSVDTFGNSDDMQIFCPVCGNSYGSSAFTKHIETCYRKVERGLSYETLTQAKLKTKHKLYCDEYDPKERKYCKRLGISCPEHTKRPKFTNEDICACPLDDSFSRIFSQSSPGKNSNGIVVNEAEGNGVADLAEGQPNNFVLHSSDHDPVFHTYNCLKRKVVDEPLGYASPSKVARKKEPKQEIETLEPESISLPYSPNCRRKRENSQCESQSQESITEGDDSEAEIDPDSLIRNYGKTRFCKLTKKQCSRHFNWEITFRSALDIQRARLYTRLEELARAENRCNLANATKYDMLSILTHRSIDHRVKQEPESMEVS